MKATPAVNKVVNQVPTLALRGITVFPGALFHFDVGRQKSIRAMEYAMANGQRIFLVTQRDVSVDDPGQEDLYSMGTYCKVRQILKIPGDNIRVLVEGKQRALLRGICGGEPFLTADIELLPEISINRITKRDQASLRNAQELFMEYTTLMPQTASDIIMQVMAARDPGTLSDYIAQNVQMNFENKQMLLELQDPRRRMALLLRLLAQEIEILQLEQDIQEKVKAQMDKGQRDYYLREQIKAINEELGEGEDASQEAQEYMNKIAAKNLPAEVEEKLVKEVKRLAKMQSSSPESGVSRSYLDVCLDLPWTETKKENDDIKKARAILDEDHYGLEKVKERILEFFAVKNLTGGVKGQILCLAGPPGVGKTSVARSIARCMGRDYARLSLGGVRDEAEIRGHRRTYIGAIPGRIISSIKQAGTMNPVFLFDEIDKMASDVRGDPASAMLEVLDSAQNNAFRDHYLECPFDLSGVMFITTANSIDTIPRPLLDRMEVIEVSGYTEDEKLNIAKRHLLPRQIEEHGLAARSVKLSDRVLRALIQGYTREAGVRRLQRTIGKVVRKSAVQMIDENLETVTVTPEKLTEFLGAPRYHYEKAGKKPEVGVVNGLAYTVVGGDTLQIETTTMPGTGQLELTGSLGDVMKESARAAKSYVRAHAAELGIAPDFYKTLDIHIHVPEGAVPKDGPSAGVTMTTALVSALTGIPVRQNVAMTGEITLRGRVLPIGGLKEKLLAAHRAGIDTVLIPKENLKDLEEVPENVRGAITILPAETVQTVLDAALTQKPAPKPEQKDGTVGVPPLEVKSAPATLQA